MIGHKLRCKLISDLGKTTLPSYNIDQTRELLLRVWSVLLMVLYGIGFLREKMLVQQAEALKVDVLPDAAKLFFFALMFVAFLIDIVEMREDKEKAYRFLFLSLMLGGLSATISAIQYRALSWLLGV